LLRFAFFVIYLCDGWFVSGKLARGGFHKSGIFVGENNI